jgi:hypothetical protein
VLDRARRAKLQLGDKISDPEDAARSESWRHLVRTVSIMR